MAVCAAFRDVRKEYLRLEFGGQMGIQDVDSGASPAVTHYILGARPDSLSLISLAPLDGINFPSGKIEGIDAIYKTVAGNTTSVYPIYDAHGNMVGDVSKVGNGAYALNDRRSFDAWGLVRQGNTTGDPKGRYCANLGHKHDDESGLIYMRARYYEPGSGRFLSEDPNMQKRNWLIYNSGDPINKVDFKGKDETFLQLQIDLIAILYGDPAQGLLAIKEIAARVAALVAKTAQQAEEIMNDVNDALDAPLGDGPTEMLNMEFVEQGTARAASIAALGVAQGNIILVQMQEVVELLFIDLGY